MSRARDRKCVVTSDRLDKWLPAHRDAARAVYKPRRQPRGIYNILRGDEKNTKEHVFPQLKFDTDCDKAYWSFVIYIFFIIVIENRARVI